MLINRTKKYKMSIYSKLGLKFKFCSSFIWHVIIVHIYGVYVMFQNIYVYKFACVCMCVQWSNQGI